MKMLDLILGDVKANRRNPKGVLLTVLYRVAHACMGLPPMIRPLGWLYIMFYKAITELILGTEIHWRCEIGPELCVYHGFGVVIHSSARIGAHCTLRHGVTIGIRGAAGEYPKAPALGDRIDIGAHAILIGSISVGDDAIIGAGAVVIGDVPAGATVVGNPARIIRRNAKQEVTKLPAIEGEKLGG